MIKLIVSLLEHAGADLGFLRLVNYITVRALLGMATSLGISLIFGFRFIVYLYDHNLRDSSGDYLSLSAESKRGTPTAGGLILLTSTVVSIFLWGDLENPFLWPLLGGFFYLSLVGFLDDALKSRFKSSLSGLSQLGKTVLLLAYIVPFALFLVSDLSPVPADQRTLLYIPFYKTPVLDLGPVGYALFAIFVIFAIVNAVNITDGMDGLLCGTSVMTLGVYVIFAYILGNTIYSRYLLYPYLPGAGEIAVFGGVLMGGVLGFMWFNTYPAEAFMGDTGSLGIGGVLAMMALLTKQEMLFPIVGGVFVFEIFTSLLQQKVGDRLGRRLLYRAPFHHSMSHAGIPETKVVVRFWLIALVLVTIGVMSLKIR